MELRDLCHLIFIFFCFLISLFGKYFGLQDAVYLRIAMFFTFISDFLILKLSESVIGVATFCIVHLVYILRFSGGEEFFKKFFFGVTLSGIILSLLPNIPVLHKMCIIYFVCFLCDIIACIKFFSENKNDIKNLFIMPFAIILFAFCDISVVIYNTNIFPNYSVLIYNLIWIFYIPAQFILCLSNKKFLYAH